MSGESVQSSCVNFWKRKTNHPIFILQAMSTFLSFFQKKNHRAIEEKRMEVKEEGGYFGESKLIHAIRNDPRDGNPERLEVPKRDVSRRRHPQFIPICVNAALRTGKLPYTYHNFVLSRIMLRCLIQIDWRLLQTLLRVGTYSCSQSYKIGEPQLKRQSSPCRSRLQCATLELSANKRRIMGTSILRGASFRAKITSVYCLSPAGWDEIS